MSGQILFDIQDLQTRYRGTAVERYAQAMLDHAGSVGLNLCVMPRPFRSRWANRLLARNWAARTSEVFAPQLPDDFALASNLSVIFYDFVGTNAAMVGAVKAIRNRLLFLNWARRAKRIFFFSQHLRHAFCIRYGDDATLARTHVLTPFLLPGFSASLAAADIPGGSAPLPFSAEGNAPYLLALGTGEPRKNLPKVLHLFSLARQQRPELQLVLYGHSNNPSWITAKQLALADTTVPAECIHLTGRVDDATLVTLMRRAEAFLFPSFEEGVGLPPMEALAAGTKALISDDPVMVELLGQYDHVVVLPLSQPEVDRQAMETLLKIAVRSEIAESVRARFVVTNTVRELAHAFSGMAAANR